MAKAIAVRLDAGRDRDPGCGGHPVCRGPLDRHSVGRMEPTMTPDEIRTATAHLDIQSVLQEIAAQLAELVLEIREIKSDMKRVDEQLFGGKT